MKDTPIVSIVCTAFNHENFIRDALEGFIMQKTNFPFEIIVHDDASIDKTASIIKKYESEYPQLFVSIYQTENQFSKKEVNIWTDITFPRARGKYIAICEGDDYWTDPYKLQKQVDFLENNTDYGMVHTGIKVVDLNNELIFFSDSCRPSGEVLFDLLKSAFVVTCSTCFKKSISKEAIDQVAKEDLKCVFDYWLWLHIAMRSKIHYMPEITSAYRSHSGGVTKGNFNYFKEILPLAVLNAISCKLIYFPEKDLNKKWELYINYCRALTASALSWHDRKRYFKFLLNKPIFFLAFFPALWRKIQLRFSKKKS